MFPQLTKSQMKGLVSATMVLTLVGALMAPMAFARAKATTKTLDRSASASDHGLNPMRFRTVSTNGIVPFATIKDRGRQLIVTVAILCDGGERSSLRLTVSQRSTGAVAEGQIFPVCSGGEQQLQFVVTAQGGETFEEGPAVAVVLGRTTTGGKATDAHQWMEPITLERE